jgi:hypothetical protein
MTADDRVFFFFLLIKSEEGKTDVTMNQIVVFLIVHSFLVLLQVNVENNFLENSLFDYV